MDPMLAAKLALEQEVAAPLFTACSLYIAEWRDYQGNLPYFARLQHTSAIEAILTRHYARVVMVVTGRKPDQEGRLEDAALNYLHAQRLQTRAREQAAMIIAGVDREIAKARLSVQEGKTEDIQMETKESFVTFTIRMATSFIETAKKAVQALAAKIGAIANVQTQGPAEEAVIEWVDDNKDADSTIFNVWVTMKDDRVRDWHSEAEGQERRLNVPFDVGGEQLRYPGDASLGASLRNLINCRCSLSFIAVDANGNRRDLNLPTPHAPTRSTRTPGQPLTSNNGRFQPTELVTLNGTTRARIVLGDGKTLANLRQVKPDTIVISINRKPIARATFKNGKITSMQVDPKHQSQGIGEMIRRSVANSFNRGNR